VRIASTFVHLRNNGSFLRQLSWSAFGQIGSAVGLLIGIRLLTEFIPPVVYGKVTVLLGLAALGYSIFCAPFTQAALRFYPDARKSLQVSHLRHTIVDLEVKAAGLASLLLVGGWLVYGYLTEGHWWTGILLAALLAVDACKCFETGLMNAAQRQRSFSLWNIGETWARPVCAIILVGRFGASPELVLAGYLLASVCILLLFRLRGGLEGAREVNETTQRHTVFLEEIYRYALPLVPTAIVGWINAISDRYIIGGLLGLEQLGIYAAVYGLVSRPFIIMSGIVGQSFRPLYFDAIVAETGISRNIVHKWLFLASGICVLGFFAVVLLRHQIVHLLMAPRYRSGVELVPWIALGYCFYSISSIYENIFYAYKRTEVILTVNSLVAVMTVLVSTSLAYYFGLKGAAMSVSVVYLVKLLINRYGAKRVLSENGHV
jgi:O-antigen/teichoic acid export membrane protein